MRVGVFYTVYFCFILIGIRGWKFQPALTRVSFLWKESELEGIEN